MNNRHLQGPDVPGPTFVDVLRHRASSQPDQVAYRFLEESELDGASVTFAELDQKARAIAAFLASFNMRGQRALILLPSGLEYIYVFFGCLYAGVIAIPGFPLSFGHQRRSEVWLKTVLDDAHPKLAFATPGMIARLSSRREQYPSLFEVQWVNPETIDLSRADDWRPLPLTTDTVAFLQYTSGSTSNPRGVMISHGNILHNQRVIQGACNSDQESTVVGWLPLYHDMGLVGTVLHPAYIGAQSVLMAPARFLQDPICWLQAISEHRGQSSSAPNFAYDLCCRRITEEQKRRLDLRSWRIAVNGAEPVRHETMQRFAANFGPYGFQASAFLPSYGLAESTLMVTGGRGSDMPATAKLSAHALEQNIVREAREGEPARILVGCGSPSLGQEIKIVDPVTLQPGPERTVGEIWVRGPSVGHGYWNRLEETASTFQAQLSSTGEGHFLRTGDLGFWASGQLFITGRLKDLIIIRGRNLYPQDIETTVETSQPSLRTGCCAVFTVEVEEQDAVVIVSEMERHSEAAPEDVISAVREAVALEHGIQAHAVVLVKSGSIPKTTSGKIRRTACRELYLADQLDTIARHIRTTRVLEAVPGEPSSIFNEILQTAPDLRLEMVESHLRSRLGSLLNMSPKEILPEKPLVSLGLDSLTAVQLRDLIEAEFGPRLDTLDLLQGSSLSEVVANVLEGLGARDQVESSQYDSDPTEFHPLTCGQQGLWTLHQMAPRSVAYTLINAARVKTDVDLMALERAFGQLMARHDMLRTVFPVRGGKPVQFIKRMEDLSFGAHFQYRDLSTVVSVSLADRLEEEAHRPFLLEREPSIRFLVFRLPSEEYVLMLVLHHIIADLWSIEILLQELGILYSAEREGRPILLPKMRATYLDFSLWQADNIEGPKAESLLSYWLRQLSGELPVLQLPADRPRPAVQSYSGAAEPISLKPGLHSEIEMLARSANATPFMVLVAAFQILLHRVCGQDDVLLGTPTSGRSKPEFADVIGYCVNPIILRSNYRSEITFRSYLAEVRRTVLEAFEFQDCPFPHLVEKLQQQRVSSIPPVFQAFFVWQKARGRQGEALAAMSLGQGVFPLELADLTLESVPMANRGSQFDLTLMMAEHGADLLGSFKYSTDLFDAATVKRLANQLSLLLEAMVADPGKQISMLPLLRDAEQEQLVRDWNSMLPPSCDDRCIHQLFEEQAERQPEKTALIVGDRQISYAQLNAQANQFARHLRGLGVASEMRVGICLNRSVELIVAILGIWKSGAAYVPFDPRDPKERLSALMERSAIHVLIVHEQLLDRLPEEPPQLVLLDLDLDLIAEEPSENPAIVTWPQSLAYVIYTSGSTGEPKGAMVQHRSVMNLLSALRQAIYNVREATDLRVGLNASMAFDASVKQLLALAMGYTLCLVLEDTRRNGEALLAYIQKSGLQVLDCTPTQVELLLEAGFAKALCQVTLLLGGEPVPDETWKILAKKGGPPCYNLYGPTECTVDATICRIGSVAQPSIGKSLAGVRVYLLDQHFGPVPVGAAGEIFIGGESVGRGYFDQPGLTAEKFLPDAFSPIPGSRMYRSGDRARYTSDLNIQFIGRVDRQIKIRGFRIELGEIEQTLRKCPGVTDAAVVVNEYKQVIAYIVSAEERASNHYRQLVAQKIPEYMVPAAVVTVPSIPVNANGKRDYTALSRPELSIMERGNDYVMPQSALEEYLVEMWVETLRVEPIGIHDNFFALGGDSLQATKIIARVQEKYPTDTPLIALFFQEPTVAALAQFISFSCQLTE